jgi:hypothetical protein
MTKERHKTKKWKIGERYYIYDNGEKLWGTIVTIKDNGDHIVEWDCCITTNEGLFPDPASDYFRKG